MANSKRLVKKWPKDGKTLSCEKLIGPVKELAKQMIRWENIGRGKDLVGFYKGYDFPDSMAATGPAPEDLLTIEGQEYEIDQARDPIDTLLLFAFVLGIEQGRRMKVGEVAEDLESFFILLSGRSFSNLQEVIKATGYKINKSKKGDR